MNNNHFFAWLIRTRGDVDIIAKYAECVITCLNRWICARGRGWETLSPARKVTQPPLHEKSSSACVKIFASTTSQKHCQRHNGPEGWVLLTKVTYFSHITRSNTKFDQISSLEYWPSTSFKISTTATSASWLNFNFKLLTKHGSRISAKIKLHYLYKTSAAK